MIAVLAVWCVHLGAAQEPYQWPLDLPRVLTSSFAEYRPGRFHAGIDLRTGGIGRPVKAPASGHVSRVRCSPWGYGKAIYITFDNGYTAVFGHLDAFAPPLAEYICAEQHRRRSYTVDLYPKTTEFPVLAGEVVAYSGDSGAGAAHLHYEIRDANERPVNLRALGIEWPDTTRPVVRSVLIVPQGPDSSINGDMVPLTLTARSLGDGAYVCDPVRASGPIAFGIDVIDPANQGANKLGIFTASVSAGGNTIFKVQNDCIAYDAMRHGAVSYHPLFTEQGRYLVLYRWRGNSAEPFHVWEGDGWLETPLEPLDVVIDTADFLGNAAKVTIPLSFDPGSPAVLPEEAPAGTGTAQLDCMGEWLLVSVRFSQPESETPELLIEGPAPAEGGVFHRVGRRTFRAGYKPVAGSPNVTLRVRHPRVEPFERHVEMFHRGYGGRTVNLDGAEVTVGMHAPYGTLFLWMEPTAALPSAPVPVLGSAYRIEPAALPVDDPVRLSIPLPAGAESPARVRICRAGSWGWSWQGGERLGDRIETETRAFGTFAALEDTRPPSISDVRIAAKEGVTQSRRPAIQAIVTDDGSGVADIEAYCGEQWLLVAYDPDTNKAEWAQDEDLPTGRQTILLRAQDDVGNRTEVTRVVTVPGS